MSILWWNSAGGVIKSIEETNFSNLQILNPSFRNQQNTIEKTIRPGVIPGIYFGKSITEPSCI